MYSVYERGWFSKKMQSLNCSPASCNYVCMLIVGVFLTLRLIDLAGCSETQIACDKEPKCVDIEAVCDGFPGKKYHSK